MTPQEIEKKYGFEYPSLYKQLYVDGMLDWGEFSPNWYFEIYPKLKDNPPLLLHSYDFELMDLKSVSQEIEELMDPDNYRNINEEFRFIPFAHNAAGDHYCFFLNKENKGELPVVFLYHDENEAEYMAKNLQDFIFRMILQDMSQQDTFNEINDEEFRNNIVNVLKSHAKYLTDKEQDILQNILRREIIDYEISFSYGNEDARGLLTDIEMKKVINEIIPFDKMDTSFEYSNE